MTKNTNQKKRNRKSVRRRRRRQRIERLLYVMILVLAVFLFVRRGGIQSFFATSQTPKEESTPTVEKEVMEKIANPAEPVDETVEEQIQEEVISGLTQEERQEALRIYRENQELLVLVNKEYELSEEYDTQLKSICNRRLKASKWLYEDLARMLKSGTDEGHSFWVASAYRSRQRQQALINEDVRNFKKQGMSEEEALAKTLEETMPAGHSEHETGLALDILDSDNMKMNQTQENYAGNQWLQEHCYEYGFILRYPKEKEMITYISYEPWHFRYVGIEAATFLKQHDLTLEEFYHILEIETGN